MRKEAVYTLLLNATLFRGMRCFLAQDPRYLRFSVLDAGVTTHYNLRVRAQCFSSWILCSLCPSFVAQVSNSKIAEELLEEINAHIPTE